MKITLAILAVLVAVVYAQPGNIVANEVHAIIAANANITVPECISKCDGVFALLNPHDEAINDAQCATKCNCQINHTHCHH